MKELALEIISNKEIFNGVYLMDVRCPIVFAPGEFVSFKVEGYTLRRPISVHDCFNGVASFVYRVVGDGTNQMTKLVEGDTINTILPLGNTFNLNKSKKPLLVGGGMGIAPLKNLARAFNLIGVKPKVLLCGRNKSEVEWFINDIEKFADVFVATDDGSLGFHGRADTVFKQINADIDYYYCCGPTPMMKAIAISNPNGELSLEARMGCGFGACMGCSIKTTNGYKRVCKEGPIFNAGEVIFE